jgi:excisionase family DNA binding protein
MPEVGERFAAEKLPQKICRSTSRWLVQRFSKDLREKSCSNDLMETNSPGRTADSSERLAFTMKEAAATLGVSYHSILRLIQRGKLKSCTAIPRRPLIAKTEILRLLRGG